MNKPIFYDLKFHITSETTYIDNKDKSIVLAFNQPLLVNITVMRDSKDSKEERVHKILKILEKELLNYEYL